MVSSGCGPHFRKIFFNSPASAQAVTRALKLSPRANADLASDTLVAHATASLKLEGLDSIVHPDTLLRDATLPRESQQSMRNILSKTNTVERDDI